MSLTRLILWSSLIGGWSAFFGWLLSESALHLWIKNNAFVAILMATLVAIPIGGGVCFATGLTNPNLQILAKRFGLGLAGGLLGGLLGSLVGSCMFGCLVRVTDIEFFVFVGQVIGWTLIGTGIGVGVGVSEGLVDRSFTKLRNGLIGGVVGGFLGGLFFGLVSFASTHFESFRGYGNTSRAVSFVLLGLAIGLFIGLAQVILKEAWITVEAGFRPGRQIILGSDLITMGTSEKSSMIFIAFGAKGVEPTHLKITRQQDGRYLLEDNHSRSGTLLNGQPIAGTAALRDGDAIQFGVNVVRFNERGKHEGARLPVAETAPAIPVPAGAIQAQSPAQMPLPTAAIAKPAPIKPASPVGIQAPKPAPTPIEPKEGRCPICDKKVVGIPGARRCGKCFTTF